MQPLVWLYLKEKKEDAEKSVRDSQSVSSSRFETLYAKCLNDFWLDINKRSEWE